MEGIDSGRIGLLESLKEFTLQATSNLIMPTHFQRRDEERICRAADVYLMRLPDSKSAMKKAPYILHQLITGKDQQTPGTRTDSSVQIRSIFCVYNENEQEGGLMLLNLMERVRIPLLRQLVIDKRYKLLLDPAMEALIYPEDSAPYFAGEMVSTWKIPAIEREVKGNL